MYYYKEIKIGVKFSVTVEIDGYSEDGKFFKLFQDLNLELYFMSKSLSSAPKNKLSSWLLK